MQKEQQELAWRIGGPQGSGVDTAARLFARACVLGGLHVFGRREYYSNIKGRHSYYDIRAAHHPLSCHREDVDLLVTFEGESLVRHALSVVPGGGIIYNERDGDLPFLRLPFLDPPVRDALEAYLEERGLPKTTRGLLEDARQRGVQIYGVPYSELTARLAERMGIPHAKAERTLNTMAVALSAAMLEYPQEFLFKALEKVFAGRQKIIDLNVEAVRLVYEFVSDEYDLENLAFRMVSGINGSERMLLNATQAVAMGKIAAGMTFQSYYPISPATDESVYLEAHATFPTRDGEQGSVVVVQTEDEISAVTMASGAAYAGARSATATSGPGFALMAEGLGWAGINEIPLVITLYQRGGPSTGMPTRTEQGDLLFAVHGGHGDFPRIVLASGDVEEAFYDAIRAFNYAEKYQMPVIHLLDKTLSSATQSLEPFDPYRIALERGEWADPAQGNGSGPYPRFQVTETGISPRVVPGQARGQHWLTGAEHTELGRVTEDPRTRVAMMDKRARKLAWAAKTIPAEDKVQVHGDVEASLTLLAWGSTKGAILEALQKLEKAGIRARFLQLRILWPFPAEEIAPYLETAQPLVTVELNQTGQLAQLLRQETGRRPDHQILKYTGRPFSARELVEALKEIVAGTAPETISVFNPFE